jgi:FtsP/CotA-like multicopper oxidase with cupredoxin domain
MLTRRRLLAAGALAGGAVALPPMRPAIASQIDEDGSGWETSSSGDSEIQAMAPGRPGVDYQPVITPGGSTLPWKVVDGAKVFHLVAEEVLHEFAPGLSARCWGYNGSVHGPTIEAVEGDHVRIYVTNRLPAPTSVHWHGVFLPNGMDGVGNLTQRSIPPGATYKYEFIVRQHGTHMYHSHHDEMTQMAMGMLGLVVFHPRKPSKGYRVDRDFAILLSEWRVDPGTRRPNPNEMRDFNVLTMNAKAFPATVPLVAKRGDRVRIRLANLSPMEHHPIHLHGHRFWVTATDGGDIPVSARWPQATVLVPVGSTRDIEFTASAPGDWPLHCHMTHHLMNQMGHDVPNMVGVRPGALDRKVQSLIPDYMTMGETGMAGMSEHGMPQPANSIAMQGAPTPFGMLDMAGMFTIVKIREGLTSYDDPGWDQHPAGTVSDAATAAELRRDEIGVRAPDSERER